jgi:RNA polymerase sigma-70 factor (ECF subfamily)
MRESHVVPRADRQETDTDLLALYDAQVGDLYAFVLRRCGNVQLAEDLTQDVFVAAAGQFRDTSVAPAPAWLYQLARNRLIDHWRRRALGVKKHRLACATDADVRVTDVAERVVSAEQLMTALDKLPVNQRAVLVLRYLDEYTVSQIAEALGRTVRATESLLVRARQKFELSYKEQAGE